MKYADLANHFAHGKPVDRSDAAAKATDKEGRPYVPPDNSAAIYAAINQTPAGFYLSIWSLKAHVWARLLNRYPSRDTAHAAIDTYGFIYWDMAVPPHSRDTHLMREKHKQEATVRASSRALLTLKGRLK